MSVPSPPPPPAASSRIPSVHRIPSVQVYRGVVVLGECFLVYTLLESLRLHEEPPPHVSRLGTCSLHVGTLVCSTLSLLLFEQQNLCLLETEPSLDCPSKIADDSTSHSPESTQDRPDVRSHRDVRTYRYVGIRKPNGCTHVGLCTINVNLESCSQFNLFHINTHRNISLIGINNLGRELGSQAESI